jgi:hypothetical protein
MSGNIALLHLPDDQRLHVQLTTYFYASTLARLRNDIIGDRVGIAVVEVAMPINAPLIQIAMNRGDAFIRGFRVPTAPHWWAFKEDDKPLPTLPGYPSRSMGLTGNYAELGLPTAINMPPGRVLNLVAGYDGRRRSPDFCQAIVLLLFLLAEALRFDNVLMECVRYFSWGPSLHTIHPAMFRAVVHRYADALPGDPNLLLTPQPNPRKARA